MVQGLEKCTCCWVRTPCVTRSHILRVTGFRTPYVTGFYMHVMVIHHVPLGFYHTTSHWVINMSLGYTPCITQFCINTCHWVMQPVSMHGYYMHITGPDIHQASLVSCHVLMHYIYMYITGLYTMCNLVIPHVSRDKCITGVLTTDEMCSFVKGNDGQQGSLGTLYSTSLTMPYAGLQPMDKFWSPLLRIKKVSKAFTTRIGLKIVLNA